ncbi:MAG: ABC transporter ATP-binding protein [Acidobacteria bacterium]|nr:MAG: ABC transporter ATP-binding protein [Acidobacteriota bacterium]
MSRRRPPALEVEEASKAYGEVRALDRVSLTADGGIHGVLGANGAGKSTLFQAVLHLVEIDGGSIRVAGFDARRQALEARRRIGYLPEEPLLDERLTGAELMRFVCAIKGAGDGEGQELLAEFGLASQADQLIQGYSLGMRKKLALAAALAGRPPLLLLDEPLNGLDADNMRRLRLRLKALAAAGTTIVLASHVMAFVERVCDGLVILRRGRIVARGSPAALRRQSGLAAATPFEDVFLHLALGEDGEDGGS